MSNDKRKVSTDALETLGYIISDEEKRDAIHLAVEPVVAKESLWAGNHVTADGRLSYPGSEEAVGIVDPFLLTEVAPGKRFWLVIYPRQIHSLRHVWTHHAFPDDGTPDDVIEEIKISKEWISKYAEYDILCSYDFLMNAADKWVNDFGPTYSSEMPHIPDEFWDHYEIVRKTKVPEDGRGDFFADCCC